MTGTAAPAATSPATSATRRSSKTPKAPVTPLLDVARRPDRTGRGPAGDRLAPTTLMGAVELLVHDRRAMEDFYVRGVGLTPLATAPGRTVLGLGDRVVVTLLDAPGLASAPRGSAGLFHTAVVFDNPADLARSLVRLWVRRPESFEGPGDHLVSQAFYFHDPEGNGVELYYDRPRETWQWHDGRVAMAILSIDPEEFLATHLGVSGTHRELAAAREGATATGEVHPDDALDVAGQVGHVHLRVGDVASARDFYVDALGFDVTSEMGDSALFVSAGGYHHHMAMNVWTSRGAGMRAPALGLGVVAVLVPDESELASARERLVSRGLSADTDVEEGVAGARARLVVADPWGNRIRLGVADAER